MWANRGMPGELYATLPTEISSKSRGEEITTWMEGRDNRYVILDDEYNFDISQEKYLILTNSIHGLTLKDAQKAVEILNG